MRLDVRGNTIMHVGKLYKTAFRRDLMVFLDFPALWPDRLRWDGDTFRVQTTIPDTARRGIFSAPADYPFHDEIRYDFFFPSGIGFPYHILVTFKLIGFGASLLMVLDYHDTSGAISQLVWTNADPYLNTVNGCGWTWNTSTPPPAWNNTPPADNNWVFPGGNDFLQYSAVPW